jgi:hypothetical protein
MFSLRHFKAPKRVLLTTLIKNQAIYYEKYHFLSPSMRFDAIAKRIRAKT